MCRTGCRLHRRQHRPAGSGSCSQGERMISVEHPAAFDVRSGRATKSVVAVFEAVVVRSMREETSEADKSELHLRTC